MTVIPPAPPPFTGQSANLSPVVARLMDVDQLADADQRLYGMMQHLMAVYAQQQAPEKPDRCPRP